MKRFAVLLAIGLFLLSAPLCFGQTSDTGQEEQVGNQEAPAAKIEAPATTTKAPAATQEDSETVQEAKTEEAPEAVEEKSAVIMSDILVEEAVICKSVEDRTPIEPGDVFPKEIENIYCFTRIVGVEGEREVVHNWYYNDNLVAEVTLFVGSPNWRTFSSKAILPEYSGDWKVEVVLKNGELLKQIMFVIQ